MASPVTDASPAIAASPGVLASPAAGACVEAEIYDFEFEPVELTVSVGTTVRWTNEGPTDHTATANDGSFDSGILPQGATFQHTFAAAGTFGYFCEIHPNMTGTVIVQ